MLDLHRQRYPHTHDSALILRNFTDFSFADDEPDPICLQGKHWEFIRYEIAEMVAPYQ
ncbi:hypothetical protein FHW36_108175 [Chitinophaga polysaccharea]|uniref:Uncharacterized protein n=1 Tax=Chitinophaga polysaccharea TaxID=1293035 RepID=A0A561PCI4_9BACT|nr:hypothetical protein FHW36_108175 [Chitinophaga polysaccharea]